MMNEKYIFQADNSNAIGWSIGRPNQNTLGISVGFQAGQI